MAPGNLASMLIPKNRLIRRSKKQKKKEEKEKRDRWGVKIYMGRGEI